MNTLRKLSLSLFLMAALAFAQTSVTQTTLNGAIAVGATQLTLTSSTGVTVSPQTGLYMDRDYMVVTGNVSGNTWTVRHAGGIQSAHLTLAPVFVGPAGAFDLNGNDPTGSCTSTAVQFLPRIMVKSGNLLNCANGRWGGFGTYADRLTLGALLVGTTTLAPTSNFHHITGATPVTTITPPPAFQAGGGCIRFIPDLVGYFTSTGGNIALATTTVASKALTMCYDVNAARWYPSY